MKKKCDVPPVVAIAGKAKPKTTGPMGVAKGSNKMEVAKKKVRKKMGY